MQSIQSTQSIQSIQSNQFVRLNEESLEYNKKIEKQFICNSNNHDIENILTTIKDKGMTLELQSDEYQPIKNNYNTHTILSKNISNKNDTNVVLPNIILCKALPPNNVNTSCREIKSHTQSDTLRSSSFTGIEIIEIIELTSDIFKPSEDNLKQELCLNEIASQLLFLHSQLSTLDWKNIDLMLFYEHLSKITENKNHKIFIAKNNDKIIGSGTILIEPKLIHDLSYVGHIEDIIVDGNYRNKGIGKLILEKLINVAKENKCYKVILDCSVANVKFYEKLGFKTKEQQMAIYF